MQPAVTGSRTLDTGFTVQHISRQTVSPQQMENVIKNALAPLSSS